MTSRRLVPLAVSLVVGGACVETPLPMELSAPADSPAPPKAAAAPPPALTYTEASASELAKDAASWDGRPVEVVDVYGGWIGAWRPADSPRAFAVSPDRGRLTAHPEPPGTSPDLQRIRGVFRRTRDYHGHEELSLELHRLEPLPREAPLAVDLAKLEREAATLDRRRVELTGTYQQTRGRSVLGRAWVEAWSKEVGQAGERLAGRVVVVRGRLYTKRGGHGRPPHYPFLLVAESFEPAERVGIERAPVAGGAP